MINKKTYSICKKKEFITRLIKRQINVDTTLKQRRNNVETTSIQRWNNVVNVETTSTQLSNPT